MPPPVTETFTLVITVSQSASELSVNLMDEFLAIRITVDPSLSGALYSGVLPAGKTALDIVLKERRVELAFEGHRMYDVYRNKLSVNRTYWGYHLPGLSESDINLSQQPAGYTNMVVHYTNNRIIYYVPVDEINTNTLCTQND